MKKLEKISVLVIVLIMVMGAFAHSQQTIPPAQGLPNLTIVGNGGVDLAVRAVAINCDIPPINLRLVRSIPCYNELQHELPPVIPNHFPQNAIVVESDGEYNISYLSWGILDGSLAEPHGISIDIVEEKEFNAADLIEMIVANNQEGIPNETEKTRKEIFNRFYDICQIHSREREGPCTGFDLAVGNERIQQNLQNPKPECGESISKISYCQLEKGSIYYIRPILTVNNPNVYRPDHGQLWVSRRCCSQTRYALSSQIPLGGSSASPLPASLACPCQIDPDSTSRKMLRAIYRNDILLARHGEIQLFEATIRGNGSYKFSFDPSFDGQFVFYKFGAPDDYNSFSVVANQSFNDSDGQTDIMLNNLGDCSTVYVALAVEPCAAGDLPITVGPAN